MNNQKNASTVANITTIVFLIFLILKLTRLITWSWWWVTSPFWIPICLILCVPLLSLMVVSVLWIFKKFRDSYRQRDDEIHRLRFDPLYGGIMNQTNPPEVAFLNLHGRKWCFYIDPGQNPNVHGGYVPSVVIADESGHFPLLGRGAHASPWVWGKTLEEAEDICKQSNAKRGISPLDALEILSESMHIR